MAFDSLSAFVAALRRAGELHTVTVEVDPYLEISEITDRVVKAGGPALFFERVRGSRFPVVTNQFGSERRMAMALGAKSLDDAASRIRKLLDLAAPPSSGQGFSKLLSLAPLANLFPRTVETGSCQDVVLDEPDVTQLPVLTTWPLDAGPFITLPLVITADPRNGRRNIGLYRMQVYGPRETAMHWQRHKQGRAHAAAWGNRVPVAVAIGACGTEGISVPNTPNDRVLHEGAVLSEGSIDHVSGDARVVEVYLGR